MITLYSLKNILRSLVESREVTWKGDLSFKTTNLASVRAKAKPQFSIGVAVNAQISQKFCRRKNQ